MWPIICLYLIIWAIPGLGQQAEKERAEFKALIKSNPNYFGTFPKLPFKAVKLMQFNEKYESLACLGFFPRENRLEAIIKIKLEYGYGGDLCSPGSREYIRFFVDWNNDGDYLDKGEDAGLVSINVHNILNTGYRCLKKDKPIFYAVSQVLDPSKHSCPDPYLVKVKAILSWDDEPTAGDPNYKSVWGNFVEKWIQIKPSRFSLVKPKESIISEGIKKEAAALKIPAEEDDKELTSEELKNLYKDKKVPEWRFMIPEIIDMAGKIKDQPNLKAEYKKMPEYLKYKNFIEEYLALDSDTEYEELKCIGFDYINSQLKATFVVKRPYGFLGELCTARGSNEYVAFWVYVLDPRSRICKWIYCGTSKIRVYDINPIPEDGLYYAVSRSVDFTSLQKKCEKPVILQVKGILSWYNEPSTKDPDWDPDWGNAITANIQLKPGPAVESNEQKPFLWSIARMPVESIDGNDFTIIHSALGVGYANGPCAGPGGYTALDSPFGGRMTISGSISNAPDNPTEPQKLLYKLQYRKDGSVKWETVTSEFYISLRINSIPSGSIYQIPNSDGFYKYQKDIGANSPTVEVQDDVLGYLSAFKPEDDGLYELQMVVKNPVTNVETPSEIIKIMVDNTKPEVDIALNTGACTLFYKGDIISGTFKGIDKHFKIYSLSLEPYAPSPANSFWHKPLTIGLSYDYGINPAYPTLNAPGAANGTFELDTSKASTIVQCGYIFKIHAWDRAIVNDHQDGNYNAKPVGFCLLNK